MTTDDPIIGLLLNDLGSIFSSQRINQHACETPLYSLEARKSRHTSTRRHNNIITTICDTLGQYKLSLSRRISLIDRKITFAVIVTTISDKSRISIVHLGVNTLCSIR
eukprot:scaffold68950_cov22-Prasinocladus_malaysianus.AAC.1